MVTEFRPRNTPRINLSAREWKLYLIGGLGLAYAVSLAAIITRAESAGSQPTPAPISAPNVSQPAVVWLDQLPITQRPSVSAPPTWSITSSGGQIAVAPAPVPAKHPTAAPRIMTRTS
jgi:hypothetical protein